MRHIFSCFILLISNFTHANSIKTNSGLVTNIFDGDTIEITSNNQKQIIRLAYIDAPEINQKHGDRAKRNLTKTMLNKDITFKILDQDIYKRNIAVVFLGKTNMNKKQIHDGYAWASNRSSSNSYLSLEWRAKYYKKGLWQSKSHLSPWEFRKKYISDNIR